MPFVFTHKFDTQAYKGETEFNTGLFINGQFVDGSTKTSIEYVYPRSLAPHHSHIYTCSVVNPSKHPINFLNC